MSHLLQTKPSFAKGQKRKSKWSISYLFNSTGSMLEAYGPFTCRSTLKMQPPPPLFLASCWSSGSDAKGCQADVYSIQLASKLRRHDGGFLAILILTCCVCLLLWSGHHHYRCQYCCCYYDCCYYQCGSNLPERLAHLSRRSARAAKVQLHHAGSGRDEKDDSWGFYLGFHTKSPPLRNSNWGSA